jgi:hypothetical protein
MEHETTYTKLEALIYENLILQDKLEAVSKLLDEAVDEKANWKLKAIQTAKSWEELLLEKDNQFFCEYVWELLFNYQRR